MAKATATCKCAECGAEFTRTKICRNRADADSWEAWATENLDQCSDCWKKEEERKKEEENKLAAQKAKENKLPELQGTPKQVAWANVIRQKFLDYIDSLKPNEKQLEYKAWVIQTRLKADEWIKTRDGQRAFLRSTYHEWEAANKQNEKG